MGLWEHMGWPARTIAIILFIESIWSLAVMIDRYLYFSAARKQSREFAPKVAGALKDSKLEEAIKIADRNKKSHLAEVVTAGLQEFRSSGGSPTEETIESSGRALERAVEDEDPVLLFEHKGLYRRGKHPVAWDPDYRGLAAQARARGRLRDARHLWRDGPSGERRVRLSGVRIRRGH